MIRPRVKPEHAAYRIAGNRVRIGGLSFGIAAEVEDPTGAVWTLLQAMDGSRSADEIVDVVVSRHPGETQQSLRDAIETFVESGYVEDCGAPDPAELTSRDKERYGRGRAYWRWLDLTPRSSSWEPQVRLRSARVTVVGLGGTGGCAAAALAASGVGYLHCVDRDLVELSNLNRQVLYSESDIHRPKADMAAARLRGLNSDVTITGQRTEYQCLRMAQAENQQRIGACPDDAAGRGEAAGNAVAAPSAGISGYLAAHAVLALVTGIPPVRPGRIYSVSLMALDEPYVFTGPRRPDCPDCGGRR